MKEALVELMPDRMRNMLLLNVVCFGAWDDFLHGHVLSALNSSTRPGFHLDKQPAGLKPGMLEREALVTYVPAHGGRLKDDGTSALWGKDVVGAFSEFGIIGGRAVVLDACDTASDGWLYDSGDRLRPECQSLLGKPLLGGSGDKSKPQKSHGKWILGELVNVLSGVEDAGMDEDKLRDLLEDVLDRAATKAEEKAYNSTLRKAYKVRPVSSELQR
jgi:hypothetical protein